LDADIFLIIARTVFRGETGLDTFLTLTTLKTYRVENFAKRIVKWQKLFYKNGF
jgi:hypothetical protein